MKSNKTNKERGYTFISPLGLLVSAVAGGLFAYYLVHDLTTVPKASPFILITLMLLPMGLAVQLYTKLLDIKNREDLKGLSSNEYRRILSCIEDKISDINKAIGFYLVSAFSMAIIFFVFSSSGIDTIKWVIVFVGSLLSLSVFSVGILLSDIKSVSSLKSDALNRFNERKRQRSLIDKLK